MELTRDQFKILKQYFHAIAGLKSCFLSCFSLFSGPSCIKYRMNLGDESAKWLLGHIMPLGFASPHPQKVCFSLDFWQITSILVSEPERSTVWVWAPFVRSNYTGGSLCVPQNQSFAHKCFFSNLLDRTLVLNYSQWLQTYKNGNWLQHLSTLDACLYYARTYFESASDVCS